MTKTNDKPSQFFIVFDSVTAEVLTRFSTNCDPADSWGWDGLDEEEDDLDISNIGPSARFASELSAKKAARVIHKEFKKSGVNENELDFQVLKVTMRVITQVRYEVIG